VRHFRLLCLGLLLAGCASAGNPAIRNDALLGQIEIGKSTKEDVRKLMGGPSLSARGHGPGQYHETWKYVYVQHDANPWIYVPFLGPIVLMMNGVGQTESASFSVYFDGAGFVRALARDNMDLKMGGLITPTSLRLQAETKDESAEPEPVRFHHNMQIHTQ
jgi:outer membrane protein assembly factor BamE (lipoprotein component of BamABCDE complex)